MKQDSFVKGLRGSDSGSTLVMVAVTLPVLIGCVGLAVDVGYPSDYRKQMQSAADSAAIAGAYAVKANTSIDSTALANVVRIDMEQNGFISGNGDTTITSMPIGSSSVAALGAGGNGCLYMLSPTASKGFQASGSGTINATGCAFYTNSDRPTDAFFVGLGMDGHGGQHRRGWPGRRSPWKGSSSLRRS